MLGGENGYTDKTGERIPYAVAFQGNVLHAEGKVVTEIFIVDINPGKILDDPDATGREGERPGVPEGIRQRRLTYTQNGISATRHWLRSSADGQYIFALARDHRGLNQILRAEVNSGKTEWITHNDFSIDYSFNFSRDGRQICFVAINDVYVLDVEKQQSRCLTSGHGSGKIVGAPSFSPAGDLIVYNQYRKHADGQEYLQIRVVKLNN